MKLTKEECLEVLKTIDDGTTEIDEYEAFPITTYNEFDKEIGILKQLIDEHFELVKENELLKRENKALADDNYQKCELNEKLRKDFELVCKLHDELLENYNNQKKRMKQLEQENGKLKKQVHSYYMAMCTGKGE